MGRDADVRASLEQRLECLDEARSHRVEVAVGDLRRLEVDALAKPHVRPQVCELAHVRERPLEARLQDDADVLVPRRAQLTVDPQRVVGGRRVLHVDAHEVLALRSVAHDGLEILVEELVAEVQAERGQLHADVRVELLAREGVDRLPVGRGDRAGLVRIAISSPRTSSVASFPAAFSSRTTRSASSSSSPAM